MKLAELDRALEQDGRALYWHRRLAYLAELEYETAAERADAQQAEVEAEAADARWAARGWHGGRVSPADMAASCTFDDAGEAA